MNPRIHPCCAALSAALLLAGCEATKSSNPLSPTVAGPIAGVTITSPKLLEPGQGWQVNNSQQPLTLLIENASTSGKRPLTYVFEVATDANFNSKVFSRDGVAQGEGGRTSQRLPDALQAGRTFYWRARAQDGANTGPFSVTANFSVVAPIVIQAPSPLSPVGGARIPSLRPVFKIRNAGRSGPLGAISYALQVSANDSFTALYVVWTSGEQPNETTLTPTLELPGDKLVFWRVRAQEVGSSNIGPWSAPQFFTTPPPEVPSPAPGPGPSPSPSPSPSPGGGGSCAFNNGKAVAECVEDKYPSYLAAGVSAARRRSNMEFLRDRIIEGGKCGGMDLGWNNKRGVVGDHSVDFIAWRTGGRNEGVDIAHDYDDTSHRLDLGWAPDGKGRASYAPYPTPSCR